MRPGDTFLVGVDLIKDRSRLLAAYDDAAGVTAAFNLNVLSVLNRHLGAQFAPQRFDHVACFDEEEGRIEMRLRSNVAQLIPIERLGIEVSFEAGEDLRTEISTKFTLAQISAELEAAGMQPIARYSDPAGDFAVALACR
jgi:L-histidine N-alpha-methyltransferase